jgi:hypothetical protein
MRWKDLQQTYKRDEAAYQKALADLDAAKDDSSDDALAHLNDVPTTMRQGDSVPATVSAGILTQHEFDSVTRDVQRRIDEGTAKMLADHGPEWLRRERDSLRGQLEFLYGVDLQS